MPPYIPMHKCRGVTADSVNSDTPHGIKFRRLLRFSYCLLSYRSFDLAGVPASTHDPFYRDTILDLCRNGDFTWFSVFILRQDIYLPDYVAMCLNVAGRTPAYPRGLKP